MIYPLLLAAQMSFAPDTGAAQKTITATVNKQIAETTAATLASPSSPGGPSQEMMIIPPHDRAADLLEAYLFLKQHNIASSILVIMKDKSTLTNILDIQIMKNGTLLIFKVNTLQGEKYMLVKTEDVDSLSVL